ncbi:MAG TPA: hypothetical protein VMP01_14480 [Pirellulaceae bacterium]|nr:hypothetical protein [Pirellulaceae bacterium]
MASDAIAPQPRRAERYRFVLYGFLAVVGCALSLPLARHSFVEECPYDESAKFFAIDNGVEWSQGDKRACIDHPPLGRAIYETVWRLSPPGRGLANSRIVSAIAYVLAVGMSLWILRPDPALPSESPLLTAGANLTLACAWLSPSLLHHACRADGEALVYFTGVSFLIALISFVSRPSIWRLMVLSMAGAALVWMTLHGMIIVLAAGVGAGALLLAAPPQGCSIRKRIARAAMPVAALAAIAASALHPLYHFDVLLAHHLDHYWGLDLIPPGTLVPLSFLWEGSSAIIPLYWTWVYDAFHAVALVGVAYGIVAPRVGLRTRLLAVVVGCIVALVVGLSLWFESRWMVGQLLGIYYVFISLLIASALLSLRSAIVSVVAAFWAVSWIALPTVAFLSSDVKSGDAVVAEACRWINQRAPGADAIVFAGSRPYVMMQPFVAAQHHSRCSAYIRQGAHPDNYSALSLIDAERRLSDDKLHSLHPLRVVYVQIAASQKVSFDLAPWNIVEMDSFPHPARAIDRIDVMMLSPRDEIREHR